MEAKFSVSKYQDTKSILNRFDPRVKLLTYILLIVCIFFPLGMSGALMSFGLVILLLLISKVGFIVLWKTFKPTFFLLIFIYAINLISIDPIWLGAWYGSIYGIKLWSMLILASILTITTTIEDLTFSLSSFFKIFRIFKFPVEEFSLMIAIGLRFIPNIFIDATEILTAQQSRGLDIKSNNLKTKFQSIKLLFPPLLVNSFKRADELSNALTSKGYVIGQKRTSYIIHKYTFFDLIPFLFSTFILGFFILLLINPNDIFPMFLNNWFL